MRKNYSGNFKTKIAVAMIREQETVAELAKKYELHRSLLTRWKKEAVILISRLFHRLLKVTGIWTEGVLFQFKFKARMDNYIKK